MSRYRNLHLIGSWARDTFRSGGRAGRVRLFGRFTERATPSVEFEWTPDWNATARLLVEAVEVERLNEPDPGPGRRRHRYLEQFAAVAREIIVKYAEFQSCEYVDGWIRRIQKAPDPPERLQVVLERDDDREIVTLDLDVVLTEAQIRWLVGHRRRNSMLLWNEHVVQIDDLKSDDDVQGIINSGW